MAVLGAGAFGQVTLVKRRGEYYALKVLSKAHIVHDGLQACPRRFSPTAARNSPSTPDSHSKIDPKVSVFDIDNYPRRVVLTSLLPYAIE